MSTAETMDAARNLALRKLSWISFSMICLVIETECRICNMNSFHLWRNHPFSPGIHTNETQNGKSQKADQVRDKDKHVEYRRLGESLRQRCAFIPERFYRALLNSAPDREIPVHVECHRILEPQLFVYPGIRRISNE